MDTYDFFFGHGVGGGGYIIIKRIWLGLVLGL